jgi:hypothetical protein
MGGGGVVLLEYLLIEREVRGLASLGNARCVILGVDAERRGRIEDNATGGIGVSRASGRPWQQENAQGKEKKTPSYAREEGVHGAAPVLGSVAPDPSCVKACNGVCQTKVKMSGRIES